MSQKTLWKVFGTILMLTAMQPWCMATSYIAPGLDPDKKFNKIVWEQSYLENGNTVTPGWVQADFGRFSFLCITNSAGRGSLVTVEAPGAGELPTVKRKIFIVMNGNNTTTLLKQWFPLAGSKDPDTLKTIVAVSSEELFSILPRPEIPPVIDRDSKIQSVRWGKVQRKGESRYTAARIRSGSGSFEILWKTVKGGNPELVTRQSPGSGELPQRDEKLYIVNQSENTAVIYQERSPLFNRKGTSYLSAVAVVKKDKLMAGLKKIN